MVLESFFPVVGGGERQGALLASGLAERGFVVNVLTLRNRAGLARHERMDGYMVHRVGYGSNRWLGTWPVFHALWRLRRDYDIVYVSGLRSLGLPAALAGTLWDKPVVLRADNNGEMSGEFFDPALGRLGLSHNSPVLRALNSLRKWVLRRADRFVATVSTLEREFQASGVPAERIVRIPYAVNFTEFRPARDGEAAQLRQRLDLPANALVFCFTGRLVRWKGPMTLLQAWKLMQQHLGEQVGRGTTGDVEQPQSHQARRLIFLGAGGTDQHNCEEEAREYVATHEMHASVTFAGDVENVEQYLRASDVFVFPTTADSFAVALLEAMATSLPSVVSLAGGMGDYVRAGENALVVDGGDASGLCRAMERLATDHNLRRSLGAAARRTAEEYSPARIVERTAELLAGLAPLDHSSEEAGSR